MRVLQIVKYFDFGGAENYVSELSNTLDILGNNVFVIAGSGRQTKQLNKSVKYTRLKMYDILFPIHIIQLIYYITQHKIQVIHAHQRFPIFIAAIAGRITNIPVVATVHGRSRYDLRSKLARNYISKIIYVSQSIKNTSVIFPEIQHKIIFIPNGTFIKPINLENKIKPQICYISRLDQSHFNVIHAMINEVLPKLILNFPDISFNIIGEGKFLQPVIEDSIRINIRLNKEICIVSGYQSNISDIVQNSLLVMGVGRVAIEALACGTSVLSVNDKRQGTFIITENYAFYKENNFVAVEQNAPDPEKLFSLLTNFLNNISYYRKETACVQNLIDHDFNIMKTTAEIQELYKKCI
jgi:glycosyltransferase involved in cell wall biosynthesis